MKPLLIRGASGHGAVVAEAAMLKWKIVGFVDAAGQRQETSKFGPLLGIPEDVPGLLARHGVADLFVAIGDNFMRKSAVARMKCIVPWMHFPAIIHPSATICHDVEIGEGALICAGAVIGVGAKVGAFAIVNTRASLDHHSTLGDYASLAPAAATGGNAHIGEGTAIGMGVMIHHGITIGAWTVVGSGSLVNKDLPGGVTAFGQPARAIQKRHPDERYL
jgi:sugar O-acyltransferase (sialic acid O-acetyltransferase NeuD family)